MLRLRELVGAERAVAAIPRALHEAAREVGAPVTGAVLVSCCDEAEAEQATAFHDGFVRHMLPALKFGHHSAFRLAAPGGCYEFSAVRVAEGNFAAAGRPGERKLMIVKVNAHTGYAVRSGEPTFGYLHRYGSETPCCGALQVLLSGRSLPNAGLEEALRSEGSDRLAALRDPARVQPRERGLRAALASARLQARKVALDVQDFAVVSTSWLIAACVSINRPDRDTEILCGFYRTPDASRPQELEYFGLGDDPVAYVFSERDRRLLVTDAGVPAPRSARDHRRMLVDRAREVAADAAPQRDARLAELKQALKKGAHRSPGHSGALLSSALMILGEIAPVPAALMLFVSGAAGIHHTWKVHRVAKDLARRDDAREILRDVQQRIDQLSPEEREALLELLLRHY